MPQLPLVHESTENNETENRNRLLKTPGPELYISSVRHAAKWVPWSPGDVPNAVIVQLQEGAKFFPRQH